MNTNTKYEELLSDLRDCVQYREMRDEAGEFRGLEKTLECRAADAIEELLKGDKGNLASPSEPADTSLEANLPGVYGLDPDSENDMYNLGTAYYFAVRASQGNGGRD